MSRNPRRDVALLRKLREGITPAQLLEQGDALLSKAENLKAFTRAQKDRTNAATAKTEWLMMAGTLQEERDAAEKELMQALMSMAANHAQDIPELDEALTNFSVSSERVKSERIEFRAQIKGYASISQSLKAYGRQDFADDAGVLKSEIGTLKQDLDQALAEFAQSIAQLSGEVREEWPSALAGDGAGTAGGDAEGGMQYDYSQDSMALSEMITKYALASNDIKERIWEVFVALQEKFMERLDTWRLEVEMAAQNFSASSSGSSSGSGSSVGPSGARVLGARAGAAGGGASPGPGGLARTPSANGRGSGASPGPHIPAHVMVKLPSKASSSSSSAAAAAAAAAAAGPSGADTRDWSLTSVPDPSGTAAAAAAAGSGSGSGGGAGAAPLPSGRVSGAEVRPAFMVSGSGGWKADEHSLFIKLRERFFKDGGARGGREAVMVKVTALLPGRRLHEVLAHDDWFTTRTLLVRKRKDLVTSWQREVAQFVEDSELFLQESATRAAAQAEAAAARLAHELVREKLHDELQELRAVKAQEQAEAAAAAAEAAAAAAVAQAEEEGRRREEAAVKKHMISEYREELERKRYEREAAAAAAAEAERAQYQKVQAYNRERVEWRIAEQNLKDIIAQEREALMAEEDAARMARLDRLRALVAPEVEADPARLLAPTQSVITAQNVTKEEREERERREARGEAKPGAQAFAANHGYTQEQVFRDQRAKITEALHRAGLHNTEAGRRAIANAQTATNTRVDNMTTVQRNR